MSNSTATATSLNPNLLSALIAAVVAFIVLLLDKLFIEPRKWKKRYEIRTLERALEVHGSLITILRECHQRALLQNVSANAQYNVNLADLYALQSIFQRKSYLLSQQLRTQWENLQGSQSHLPELMEAQVASLNLPLREMRELAERDFEAYSKRYAKLTDFKPPTS